MPVKTNQQRELVPYPRSSPPHLGLGGEISIKFPLVPPVPVEHKVNRVSIHPRNAAAICKQQPNDFGDLSNGLCIPMKGLLWHLQIYYISQMLPYWRLICLVQKGQLAGMNARSSMMSGHAAAQVIPLFYF